MKYLAIVKDVWTEAWARRTVISLACLVVFLVGLYGFGVQLKPSQFNPDSLALYFFESEIPTPTLTGSAGLPENLTEGLAQASLMLALGLLSPWGVLFGFIITTGLFRDMLRPQKLYWILSKPVSRMGLLLSRFGGAVLLVAVPTFIFMTAMMLLVYWKMGVFVGGAMLSALIIIFDYMSFAVIALLVAIWTQSTALSMVSAIFLFFIAGFLNPQVLAFFGSGWWQSALEGLYYILPKTSDLSTLALQVIDNGLLPPEAMPADVNLILALGSTLAFFLVTLAIALWEFQRRDY